MKNNDLQQKLNDFNNFIKLEEEASIALKEFSSVNTSNELEFLKWLVKHEGLHYDLILIHPDTVSEEAMKTGIIKLGEEGSNFHYKTALLKHCIDVEDIFDTYYYEKLNKYNTTPKERLENQTPFDDDFINTSSLKFHLEKRGII